MIFTPDVRFEISANAGELLREEGLVVRKQEEMEKGFTKVTAAAQSASRATAIAVKNMADQAEAAAKRINSANFAFGGAGGSSGRSFRPYGLSPVAAAQAEMKRIAQYQGEILAMRRKDGLNSFTPYPSADPFAARNAAEAVARQVREGKFGGAGGGGDGSGGGGGGGGGGAFFAGGLYAGAAAATTAIAALGAAVGRYQGIVSAGAHANADFSRSMAGLISLGDNVHKIEALKVQVLALSGAWATATPEISAAMADVQRMMQGAGEAQQRSMLISSHELTDLIGGSLSENIKSAAKLMQAFGNEAGTAAQINSKLFDLYRGGMAPEDVDLIARMSIATKEAGINANETLAVFKTITTLGGNNPLLVQGFRQFVQHLDVMKQHGMDLGRGDIGEKMQNLAKFANENPDLLAKILPARSGAAASIKALADNVELLRNNLVDLKGVNGGEIFAATKLRMVKDQAVTDAGALHATDQMLKNADILRGMHPEVRQREFLSNLMRIGWKTNAGPVMQSATPDWAVNLHIAGAVQAYENKEQMGVAAAEQLKAGWSSYFDAAMKSGDPAKMLEANILGIGYGRISGTRIKDRYTNFEDLADLRRRTEADPFLSPQEWLGGMNSYGRPHGGDEYFRTVRGQHLMADVANRRVLPALGAAVTGDIAELKTVVSNLGQVLSGFGRQILVAVGGSGPNSTRPGTLPATQPSVPLQRRAANQQ